MSDTVLTCDQAIFTSIRTPMGEGYRIIAASRGLRADEKQTITKYSPSHEGLCARAADADHRPDAPLGVAFYPLPTGRLCVAISCFAGQEHTGRGGQRVYTHCAVFEHDGFSKCGYNALNLARSMLAEGLGSPQLRPKNPLPALALSVRPLADSGGKAALHPAMQPACRCFVLRSLLGGQRTIVNIEAGWIETVESLLLGVPGTSRAGVSFAAGLRFSLGRPVTLHLLHDRAGKARVRSTGQPLTYVDPHEVSGNFDHASEWISFVDRYWDRGDTAALARRTSIPFPDTGPDARERIGGLYNLIDRIRELGTREVLRIIQERLASRASGVEMDIVTELLETARESLVSRLATASWSDMKSHWPTMVDLSKPTSRNAAFARPLIVSALRCALRDDPLDAAAAALDVVVSPEPADEALTGLFDDILNCLAAWSQDAGNTDGARLNSVCERWKRIRPDCPILRRISPPSDVTSPTG